MEEAYEKKEEDFINLIESYSPGKNDNIISEYILKLYENARSHREPEKWLDQAEENISVETKEQFDQAPFMKIILRDARFSIEGAYDTIQEALELALSPGGPYFYEKTLRKDLEIIIKIKEAQTFSELCESFVKMEKPRLSGRKKKTDEIDEMLQDQCKYERNQAYNLLDDLKAAYFYENESEIFHELRRIKSPLKGLIDLTREFMIRYDEKKKNENIMDFDDMEHFALELLIDHYDEEGNPVPSKIAREKSDGYEEIYIDEYQDSNYIQDAILRCVSKESEGGHNMFMVGMLSRVFTVSDWQGRSCFLKNIMDTSKREMNISSLSFAIISEAAERSLHLSMTCSTRSCMKILEISNILKMLLLFQRWNLNRDVMHRQNCYC